MGLTVTMKSIKPKQLNIDAISKEILFELRDEAKDQQKLLKPTVETWQGEKPTFESQIDLSRGGDAVVITGPVGSTMGVKKWGWLDEGTSVRYATMSKDWRSKTAPGSFRSGRGAGRKLFVNRRRPRPGIKARGWSAMASRQRKRPFQRRIIGAIQRGSARLF